MNTQMFPVAELVESKSNARKTFDKSQMAELIASIKEKGIRVPLTIRTNVIPNEIVAGARRFRAAKELGLKEVPGIPRELTDEEAREDGIIDNLQRADLHPMEEAAAYGDLLAKNKKLSPADLAAKIGKSESYVRQRMALTNLTQPLAVAFRQNILSVRVAFLIARQTYDQQKEIEKWLKQQGETTYGVVYDYIMRAFHLDLSKAAFDTKDEKLFEKAGPCTTCPKRTGNNAVLFGDVKKGDICTDAVCYQQKERNFVKIQVGTHPKAIALSAGWHSKPIGLEYHRWRLIGKQPCKSVKEGIVVQRSNNVQQENDAKIGKVVEICDNPQCRVHFQSYSNTSSRHAPLTPAEKSKRMQSRRTWAIDQRTHFEMVQEVRKDMGCIEDNDVRRLVLEMLADYGSRYRCVLLAPAFGQKAEGETPSQKAADGRKNLETFMKKAKRSDLLAFLFTYPLTPFSDGNHTKMRDAAKRFGVNIKKIEKEIPLKKPKPAKAKTGKGGRKKAA